MSGCFGAGCWALLCGVRSAAASSNHLVFLAFLGGLGRFVLGRFSDICTLPGAQRNLMAAVGLKMCSLNWKLGMSGVGVSVGGCSAGRTGCALSLCKLP